MKERRLGGQSLVISRYCKDNIKTKLEILVTRSGNVIKILIPCCWDCRCVNNGRLPRTVRDFRNRVERKQNPGEWLVPLHVCTRNDSVSIQPML
jgi:hypothetical protein